MATGYWKNLASLVSMTATTALILAAALLFALIQTVRLTDGEWENSIALLILAALLSWNGLKKCAASAPHPVRTRDRLVAWALLLAIVPVLAFRFSANANAALLLLALACGVFAGGGRILRHTAMPLTLCLLIIPFQSELSLLMSYPLRLLSTIIAVEPLQLLGFDLEYDLTTIRIGGSEIAITDACSGIRQLEVMLLLGYLVVTWQHSRARWAVLHYLFLLPAIIVANALRITATVLLFKVIGVRALDEFYHSLFGYLLILVAVAILWWIGEVFPDSGGGKRPATAKPGDQPR